MSRCFVMLCNNETMGECLERGLFGGTKRIQEDLKAIQKGDLGFLLNYETDTLFGPFWAQSKAQTNHNPKAWAGRYPVQIQVSWNSLENHTSASTLLREICIPLFPLGKDAQALVPNPVLFDDHADRLYRSFHDRAGRDSADHSPCNEETSEDAALEVPTITERRGLHSIVHFGHLNNLIDRAVQEGLTFSAGDAKQAKSQTLPESGDPSGIKITPEFEEVLTLIEEEFPLIFVAGRAGTGKSTLIKQIRENRSRSRVAVVAPTGIAALNAEGETIHSFFRLPPTRPNLEAIESLPNADVFKNLDLLIIDEISMVRADLLDSIDKTLRVNRSRENEAFGGVQVLFVGDLFQLPPVVKREDQKLFSGTPYSTPHFFCALCLQGAEVACVELTHVFRQTDQRFVSLLEGLREGNNLNETVADLKKELKVKSPNEEVGTILCCHNERADKINENRLRSLTTESFQFQAEIKGDFGKDDFPAPLSLILKEGARVMFCKNDQYNRWVNGTLGDIVHIGDSEIRVRTLAHTNRAESETFGVQRAVWKKIKFEYSPLAQRFSRREVGSFRQFPLVPAWAISIHKSQGKTLDKALIDLGDGAFADGQVYVALSRCRTMEGISLARPIKENDVRTDRRIWLFHAIIRGELGSEEFHTEEIAHDKTVRVELDIPSLHWNRIQSHAQLQGLSVEQTILDLIEEQMNPRW